MPVSRQFRSFFPKIIRWILWWDVYSKIHAEILAQNERNSRDVVKTGSASGWRFETVLALFSPGFSTCDMDARFQAVSFIFSQNYLANFMMRCLSKNSCRNFGKKRATLPWRAKNRKLVRPVLFQHFWTVLALFLDRPSVLAMSRQLRSFFCKIIDDY